MENRHVPFIALAIAGMLTAPAVAAQPKPDSPAPPTVSAWLQREHVPFHRYRIVLKRAAHDYKNRHRTPPLFMPVAIDFFTGYLAHIHAMEEQFLYPVLEPYMTAEQHRVFQIILHDQHVEAETVQKWQEALTAHEPGTDFTALGELVDYTRQMVNRHIVLQERKLLPLMDQLTPKEQASILKGIAEYDEEVFGSTGREQYDRLISYLEEEFKALTGRIW